VSTDMTSRWVTKMNVARNTHRRIPADSARLVVEAIVEAETHRTPVRHPRPGHLAEIAAELFLSPHTIKSHQMSLYRNLGTSSRSQAVARARELGLLEG
jgi:hypothetical protein